MVTYEKLSSLSLALELWGLLWGLPLTTRLTMWFLSQMLPFPSNPLPQGHKPFVLSHHFVSVWPRLSDEWPTASLHTLYDFAAVALCLGFCQAAMIYGSWWRPSDSQ